MAEFKNINALDVLPYHDMGKEKYKKMGIDYVLKDVKPVTKEQAIEAKETILAAMRERRKELKEQE
jgi:pyruvate formate lyase activating enzyme